MLKFGSVCSGIEAASMAWEPLGWKAKWFSEIEPFPCKVLAYRHPDTPNLGNMFHIETNEIFQKSTIDILVGGTPCQSFSLAGLRGGLADDRGNLALEFCRLLIIKRPPWFVWENVPGVFSSFSDAEADDSGCIWQTSDFATLLTAFRECGYSCAWRVLDSQYFGVPQRRRRVFVVGHLGNDWRPPYKVLFEPESLRRNFTPRQKKGQGFAGSAASGPGNAGCSNLNHEPLPPHTIDCRNDVVNEEISGTLQTKTTGGFSLNFLNPVEYSVAPLDASYGKLQGASGQDLKHNHSHLIVQNLVFDPNQITSSTNRSVPTMELCHTLPATPNSPVLFSIMPMNSSKDYKAKEGDVTQALTTNGNHSGNQGGDYVCQPIPINLQAASERSLGNRVGLGVGKPGDPANTIQGSHSHAVYAGLVVRRLTPLECERLQGFPDNYTAIPGAKDGPRYKALGNSMTVNVMRWIGARIDKEHKFLTGHGNR